MTVKKTGADATALDYYEPLVAPFDVHVATYLKYFVGLHFPLDSLGVGAVSKTVVVSSGETFPELSDSVVTGIAVDSASPIGENCRTAK